MTITRVTPPHPLFRLPTKDTRANLIWQHVRHTYPGVVCFTCGNAADALRRAGLKVVEVGPRGSLHPEGWWSPTDIHDAWPHLFDATPGHLPTWMLVRLAERWKLSVHTTTGNIHYVPTGSGETAVSLALAFPSMPIVPVYNLDAATQYHPAAPLNTLVERLCGPAILNPDPSDWLQEHDSAPSR